MCGSTKDMGARKVETTREPLGVKKLGVMWYSGAWGAVSLWLATVQHCHPPPTPGEVWSDDLGAEEVRPYRPLPPLRLAPSHRKVVS